MNELVDSLIYTHYIIILPTCYKDMSKWIIVDFYSSFETVMMIHLWGIN